MSARNPCPSLTPAKDIKGTLTKDVFWYYRFLMLMMRRPYSQHRITSSQLARILHPACLWVRCRLPTPTLPTLSATIYHRLQLTTPLMSRCNLIRYELSVVIIITTGKIFPDTSLVRCVDCFI